MKGVIFSQLLEFLEIEFGLLYTEQMFSRLPKLESGGVYTTVGTYSHHELFSIIDQVATDKKKESSEILTSYGEYLFNVLASAHASFIKEDELFNFLESINDYVHPEVRKLYPESELPDFQVHRLSETEMQMVYHSKRRMIDFAIGLIKGSALHYGEQILITKEDEKKGGEQVSLKILKL